jgi:hypothetical protein
VSVTRPLSRHVAAGEVTLPSRSTRSRSICAVAAQAGSTQLIVPTAYCDVVIDIDQRCGRQYLAIHRPIRRWSPQSTLITRSYGPDACCTTWLRQATALDSGTVPSQASVAFALRVQRQPSPRRETNRVSIGRHMRYNQNVWARRSARRQAEPPAHPSPRPAATLPLRSVGHRRRRCSL